VRQARSRALGLLGVGAVILGAASSAGASPSAVDLAVNVGASVTNARPALAPNGSTVTVARRTFYVFLDVSLVAPAAAKGTVRAELGSGLGWGADAPDASEHCAVTATTGACEIGDLQPIAGQSDSGWVWDVVAPQNGTYTLRAELASLSDTDSDLSNNASAITIVVAEPTGGGGSGGSGGGSASAKASAVRLAPTRPKAGSTVVASVRVTRGGSPVRPTKVVCAASLGRAKLRGASRSASGVASCLFKTPKTGKGKSLAGSVAFRAAGASFTKRFSVKLG
jgi:hypothetical protein